MSLWIKTRLSAFDTKNFEEMRPRIAPSVGVQRLENAQTSIFFNEI
jgi:hypothetical protein